ncbi:hypothetical protein OAM67_01560 [bacterium]|nr:hypothetical protein [bacterium]
MASKAKKPRQPKTPRRPLFEGLRVEQVDLFCGVHAVNNLMQNVQFVYDWTRKDQPAVQCCNMAKFPCADWSDANQIHTSLQQFADQHNADCVYIVNPVKKDIVVSCQTLGFIRGVVSRGSLQLRLFYDLTAALKRKNIKCLFMFVTRQPVEQIMAGIPIVVPVASTVASAVDSAVGPAATVSSKERSLVDPTTSRGRRAKRRLDRLFRMQQELGHASVSTPAPLAAPATAPAAAPLAAPAAAPLAPPAAAPLAGPVTSAKHVCVDVTLQNAPTFVSGSCSDVDRMLNQMFRNVVMVRDETHPDKTVFANAANVVHKHNLRLVQLVNGADLEEIGCGDKHGGLTVDAVATLLRQAKYQSKIITNEKPDNRRKKELLTQIRAHKQLKLQELMGRMAANDIARTVGYVVPHMASGRRIQHYMTFLRLAQNQYVFLDSLNIRQNNTIMTVEEMVAWIRPKSWTRDEGGLRDGMILHVFQEPAAQEASGGSGGSGGGGSKDDIIVIDEDEDIVDLT